MGDQWDDMFYGLGDQFRNDPHLMPTTLEGDIYRAITPSLVQLNGLNVELVLHLDEEMRN